MAKQFPAFVGFNTTEAMKAQIQKRAEEQGMVPSQVIRLALRDYLGPIPKRLRKP